MPVLINLGLALYALLSPSTRKVAGLAIAALALQSFLAIEIGFVIMPAYIIFLVLSARLARSPRASTPLDGPVLAFLLVAVCSAVIATVYRSDFSEYAGSSVQYSAFRPIFQLILLLVFINGFWLIQRLADSKTNLLRLIKVFLATGSAVAIYALYQQVAFYGHLPGVSLPWTIHDAARLAHVLPDGSRLFRSTATFIEPLNLGHFLLLTALPCLAMSLDPELPSSTRRRYRAQSVLQLMALLSTVSNGAVVGGTIGIMVLLVLLRDTPRLLRRSGMILVVTLLIVPLAPAVTSGRLNLLTPALQRLQETARIETLSGSTTTRELEAYGGFRRRAVWETSFALLKDRPLTGVGIGNFGIAAAARNSAINYNGGSLGPLWGVMAELGLPGLAVLAWLTLVVTAQAHQVIRSNGDLRYLTAGLLSSFVAVIIQYMSHGSTLMDIDMWVLMGFILAAVRLSQRTTIESAHGPLASPVVARETGSAYP